MKSQALYQELYSLLQAGWVGLTDKPDETPQTTLSGLWRYAAGSEDGLQGEVASAVEHQLRDLVKQRLSGVPLSYLTGRQVFMGLEFQSSPEAMIPRKETEILARAALDLASQLLAVGKPIKVMDLCTGSGNIALTLAHYLPGCEVFGADLSGDAIHLAQRNAQYLRLDNRAHFFEGDLFTPFETDEYLGRMDMVVCNPPYISSAQAEKLPEEIIQYEPKLAFDGGPFGVKVLARLVREAPRFLKPGGWLCFEVGLGQGNAMQNLVKRTGHYQDIRTFLDEKGEIRALQAQVIDTDGDGGRGEL